MLLVKDVGGGLKMVKDKVQLPMFADNTILYQEDPKAVPNNCPD